MSGDFVGCCGFPSLLSASHHGRNNVVQENLARVLVANGVASLAISTKLSIDVYNLRNLIVCFMPLFCKVCFNVLSRNISLFSGNFKVMIGEILKKNRLKSKVVKLQYVRCHGICFLRYFIEITN